MKFLLTRTFLFVCFCAHAQKQNNNWCFGNKGGIDFNTSPPTTFISKENTTENCASVSDRNTGQLLFYTDGLDIWDRTHTLMPNGKNAGIDTIRSSAEGSVIVPWPSNNNLYIVFSMQSRKYMWERLALVYSVVDMSLNGGLGDVVAGQKAVLLDTGFTECITQVTMCDKAAIVALRQSKGEIYVYNVTTSGINTTPVISKLGYVNGAISGGTLKASPDSKKLCITYVKPIQGAAVYYITLNDIDRFTGVISNGFIIDSFSGGQPQYLGSEFSPDGKKVYTSSFVAQAIFQYDLSVYNPTAITASKKIVTQVFGANFGYPQMGPDSNIYVCRQGLDSIDRISNANLASPGCTYTRGAIKLAVPARSGIELPQLVSDNITSSSVVASKKDTVNCAANTIRLTATSGNQSYQWQDGSQTDSFIATKSGMYWVNSIRDCAIYRDTFIVHLSLPDSVSLGNDITICSGEQITLKNTQPVSTSVGSQWNIGSNDTVITISNPGKYWLRISDGYCSKTDTLVLTVNPSPNVMLGNDTAICKDVTWLLQDNSEPAGSTYLWNTGSTENEIKVNAEGLYTLTVTSKGCVSSDSIRVQILPLPAIELGDNAELCDAESLSLPLSKSTIYPYKILWQNGSEDTVQTIRKTGFYKVQLSNQCGIAKDSIAIHFHNCKVWFPSAFSPNGDGLNDLARLVGDLNYVTDYNLSVFDRWGEKVFITNDVHGGWDGNYKGNEAPFGTYRYLITYKFLGEDQMLKGDIALVR
ncbi:MAG: gliding motility-associated C-terminal domain-containing protein [Bacteroidetes bacterium]|nr:gliding motility-associated C-terminal domain-containing protein [Bacteroidota bacterium]